jgi:hypothetical protein
MEIRAACSCPKLLDIHPTKRENSFNSFLLQSSRDREKKKRFLRDRMINGDFLIFTHKKREEYRKSSVFYFGYKALWV